MFLTQYTCLPLKLHQLPNVYTIKLEETERSKNKNIDTVDIQLKLLLQNLARELMKDVNICHKNQPPHVIQTGHFLLLPYHTDLQHSITLIAIKEVQNITDRCAYSLNISRA